MRYCFSCMWALCFNLMKVDTLYAWQKTVLDDRWVDFNLKIFMTKKYRNQERRFCTRLPNLQLREKKNAGSNQEFKGHVSSVAVRSVQLDQCVGTQSCCLGLHILRSLTGGNINTGPWRGLIAFDCVELIVWSHG